MGVPFEQGWTTAGGIRTRYLRSGDSSKPPLVFHGTGGHAEAYTRNLAAHGEHFLTYPIDMVGNSLSDKPAGQDLEISGYARHLREVFSELGSDKAAISGESLGR